MTPRALIAIPACLLAAAASAQTPGFWLTGLASGTNQGSANALSADGTVAVGSCGSNTFAPGFSWTRVGGRQDFGLLPGMPPYSQALGLSNDGSTIVGFMQGDVGFTTRRAYRWTGTGPLQDLGLLPGEQRAAATGISGDGSVIVGGCEHSPQGNAFGQAFRWTNSGMQGLGYLRPNGTLSVANAISRDGSTIVGISQSNGTGGAMESFVWSQGGGMHGLPTLAGSGSLETVATTANADGAVVAGYGIAPNGRAHATRWTAAGVQDLGVLPGMFDSIARTTSDDGNTVGGASTLGVTSVAFVWTPTTGTLALGSFLSARGVQVPAGYSLFDLFAISGDGLTFAGQARNLSTGTLEGFVATIPAPCSLLILTLPALARRRRSAAW